MKGLNKELMRYYLLLMIKRDGNIYMLLNEEYSLLDIRLDLNKLENKRFISDSEGYLKITNAGEQELMRIKNKNELSNIESLIIPYLDYKVEKMNLDEVYLP